MSHCIVPDWNLKKHYQIPQAVDEDEYKDEYEAAGNKNNSKKKKMKKSSCYYSNAISSHLVPMTKYEGEEEVTWENGVGGAKPTWVRTGDTLESIVHHATCPQDSTGVVPTLPKKRTRPEYHFNSSACASASANATFCADTTWASFDSPSSFKITDDDSACNAASGSQNEEGEMRGVTGRSHSTRRSRAADIHKQSERRRRCRINQKMKTLQRLVPNANKTDKASMLDEVIEYLKQLQAQIQMMSIVRYNMPQIMMPLGMQQQQLQMSLMARMGMGGGLGMGMGMLDMTGMARSVAAQPLWPLFNPSHPFLVSPPIIPTSAPPNPDHGAATASLAMSDPYCNFLAQTMNMELHNKMAALYKQQVYQVRLGD